MWTNWGGRFDSQWSLPLAVAENARIMKSTRLDVDVHLLWNKYRTEYNAAFETPLDAALIRRRSMPVASRLAAKPKAAASDPDGAWEMMAPTDRGIANTIYVNYGKALQAYMRKLVSGNSAFDRWLGGDATALGESAVRGLRLFIGKAGCVGCHFGTSLTDNDFHVIGVPQTGAHVPATDLGRYQDVPPLLTSPFNTEGAFSDDRSTGRLRVWRKPARSAAPSAPRACATSRTLARTCTRDSWPPWLKSSPSTTPVAAMSARAAVKDARMKPLNLSQSEQSDLVEFLKSLTGDALPAALLTDTAK